MTSYESPAEERSNLKNIRRADFSAFAIYASKIENNIQDIKGMNTAFTFSITLLFNHLNYILSK